MELYTPRTGVSLNTASLHDENTFLSLFPYIDVLQIVKTGLRGHFSLSTGIDFKGKLRFGERSTYSYVFDSVIGSEGQRLKLEGGIRGYTFER